MTMQNNIKSLNLDKSKWKLTKLGELADEISVRVDNPSKSKYDRFVGLEHFVSGDIKIKNWGTTENLVSSTKAFQKGDILFARRNAYLRRASLVEFDGCCSGDAFVLRENYDKVVPGFLAFLMNSNALWDYANSNAAGTMSKRVKWRDLEEYEFLLPPKDQQVQLAELLWAMDDVIEREKNLLNKQEATFLSYSNKIFLNGIGKEFELKDIGQLIMGQSPPGESYNDNINDFPFLQGNAEFGKESPINIKYTSSPNKIAPEKSILISVRAPVGDLNIADKNYCIGRGLAALFIDDTFLRDYVFNFLKFSRTELEKRSTGSTFKAINKDTLSSLRLIIPKKDLLLKNVNELNSIIDIQRQLDSKIVCSQSLQKSLINQVF